MVHDKHQRNTICTELQRNDKGVVLQIQSQNGIARISQKYGTNSTSNGLEYETVVVLQ